MIERKWGRIINIASAHGLVASPNKSAYCASKFGVVGLTKVVALENAKIQQPTDCALCHNKDSLELIHNLCQFTDKQYIKFQELPEFVP